ncbi:MAG TPA: glycosyl hydrolase family 28-related protein [Leptolyngbyaceae cyanobacterium]
MSLLEFITIKILLLFSVTSCFVVPIVLKSLPNKEIEKTSVKDFGAVGDGHKDDTKAIQAAINKVSRTGGGIVFLPSGTYKVSIDPSTSRAITIYGKIKLQGAGYQKSIIKLADYQGNYAAIMAGEAFASDLSGFAMYDLAIDGNAKKNPIKALADFDNEKRRFALRIYVGSGIHIERCRFTNHSSTDTVTTNGEAVSDIQIKNNIFDLIGGDIIDYDHSTVYAQGQRIQISNNSFSSRNGPGTKGARTAIETHGDDYLVTGNTISGYTNGIYVTGYARSSERQIVTNNLIKNAYTGITLWSYFYPVKTSKPGLSDSRIINNEISLDINGWRNLWGDSPSIGIGLESNSDAPIKNLYIVGNRIRFTNFRGVSGSSDNLASGISFWRYAAPKINSENIYIFNNTIENSLASGLYIVMPIKAGRILQNTIINPGQSQRPFHKDYRSAVILGGLFEDVQINSNFLIDNQKINTMTAGIVSYADCVANCEVKENSLQIANGAVLEIFRPKSGMRNAFD